MSSLSLPSDLPSPTVLRLLLEQRRDHEFLDLLAGALSGSPVSRKNILSGWRLYLGWLREEDLSLLHADPAQAQAYADWLAQNYEAPATLNNRLVQARKLHEFLYRCELVQQNIFASIHGQVNPADERRSFYTLQEITLLVGKANLQMRLLVLLGASLGLTGPEVLQVHFEDFVDEGQELSIRGRKGKPAVHCTSDIQTTLARLRSSAGEQPLFDVALEGRIFPFKDDMELRSAVFQLCKSAGVTYKGWQALRNAAAIKILGETHDARGTAQKLGLGGRQGLHPTTRLVKRLK